MSEAMYSKYNFTTDLQDAILACLVAHPEKFVGHAQILNTNYFTGVQRLAAARGIFGYWRQHHKFPSKDVLLDVIYDSILRTSEEKESQTILEYASKLCSMDTGDADYVASKVIDFAKERAFYLFVSDNAKRLNEDKFDAATAMRELENVMRVGTDGASTKSAVQLAQAIIDENDTLLGNRFLCREGGMLFAASTGVGKSVAANQMAVGWSCGRSALGIKPARALKILTVQAEDDDGDAREMLCGVMEGLELTDDELKLISENALYERECTRTAEDFVAWLNERVYQLRPDLIIINPLNAYIGGKGVMDPASVTKFLRNGINPILLRYRVGVIIVHHTPKTNNKERDTQKWRASDWVYTYAGVNEIGNWARAALAIESTHDPLVFKFVAAKRGRRIGWKNDFLEPDLIKHFRQSTDKLYWAEATEEDVERAALAGEQAKKDGRPKAHSDATLLKPLKEAFKKGEGLSQTSWLDALAEAEVIISQSGLSKRARAMKAEGRVKQVGSDWWLVESKS